MESGPVVGPRNGHLLGVYVLRQDIRSYITRRHFFVCVVKLHTMRRQVPRIYGMKTHTHTTRTPAVFFMYFFGILELHTTAWTGAQNIRDVKSHTH